MDSSRSGGEAAFKIQEYSDRTQEDERLDGLIRKRGMATQLERKQLEKK
jgi:hypothetical protein